MSMEWTEGGKVGPQGVGSMEAGVREALSSMGGGPEHCEVLDRLHGNWQLLDGVPQEHSVAVATEVDDIITLAIATRLKYIQMNSVTERR